jgi:hypothetical protein
METLEAVITVLREEAVPLHWTKIQDLALRRGLIDPFEVPDVRRTVLDALASATRAGTITRRGKGVYAYALPD